MNLKCVQNTLTYLLLNFGVVLNRRSSSSNKLLYWEKARAAVKWIDAPNPILQHSTTTIYFQHVRRIISKKSTSTKSWTEGKTNYYDHLNEFYNGKCFVYFSSHSFFSSGSPLVPFICFAFLSCSLKISTNSREFIPFSIPSNHFLVLARSCLLPLPFSFFLLHAFLAFTLTVIIFYEASSNEVHGYEYGSYQQKA